MPYDDFTHVAALDEPELRDLLHRGDPQERVWAAWTLGLRMGGGSVPLLRDGVAEHPDAGTRRHLIVVLAGHRQYDVLRVFAATDPDDAVRATACQHLIGTSLRPDAELVEFLLERLEHDDAPAVRRIVLRDLTPEHGTLPRSSLASFTQDRDDEVRSLAASQLRQRFPMDELLPSPFEEILRHEKQPAFVGSVCGWVLEAGRTEVLLRLAADVDAERAAGFLDALISHDTSIEWLDAEPIAAREIASLDSLLLELLGDPAPVESTEWLCLGLGRHLSRPDKDSSAFFRTALPRFMRNLEIVSWAPAPWHLRRSLQLLRRYVREERAELRAWYTDEELLAGEGISLEQELEGLEAQARLLRIALGVTDSERP